MPLYEYQCEACGRRFERIQKFSDPPVETCPTCGGKVHKLVSSPAFQFKGTGWYVTDYSRKDKGGAEGEKSASSASSEGDKGAKDAKESKDSKDSKDSAKDAKSSAGSSSESGPASSSTTPPPSTKS